MTVMRNIILLVLFSWTTLVAKNKDIEKYIDTYQYIAISEMERTGVPASIKLAQGILESNAGRSTLARKANNHFGVKCGSRWKGKKYYKKDDDYKNGKLVKSCFRKYKNSETSYLAHSDFLLENRRYGALFRLDPTNYKKWAKGLKKAGYATSKTYDKKLIRIIEEYKLYKYDEMASSDAIAKAEKYSKPKEVFYINDAKMTYAKIGETPATIAQRTNTSISRILKYNELITSNNQILAEKDRVFLQEKRRNFRGKKKYHLVSAGETMYDISQNYGLCLDRLYKKNKMSQGTQPAVGEQIRIRGKNKKRPQLRTKIAPPPPPPPVKIEAEEVITDSDTSEDGGFTPILTPDEPIETALEPTIEMPPKETPPVVEPPQIETRRYHTVTKGETLWRISQYYGKTVEEIQRLNNLNTKIIKIGMRLRIE